MRQLLYFFCYQMLAHIPNTRFEVFPAEVEDNERVPAFDNPKLFHLLIVNFLHEIQKNSTEEEATGKKLPVEPVKFIDPKVKLNSIK